MATVEISDDELFRMYRVQIQPDGEFDGTFYSIPIWRLKQIFENCSLPKKHVGTEDWEKIAKFANKVLASDDWRKDFPKLYKKWQKISAQFIPTVSQEEILEAYTEIGSLPTDNDAVGQFEMLETFCDCLDSHTDRMWFNPWLRCQLIIQNLSNFIKES